MMHDSKIIQVEGFLGKFDHLAKLKVDDIQHMVFVPTDDGPFWMSIKEREVLCFDVITGEKDVEKTRKELHEELLTIWVKIEKGAKLKHLQELAAFNGIALMKKEGKYLKRGWVSKAKGMFQVLWEHGFIDASQWQKYTVSGPVDKYGEVIDEFSLSKLISKQYDFANEDSMLQYYGKQLGLIIDQTPKCHQEMVGEGIEYSWGCGKNHFWAIPIEERRMKKNFHGCV